MKIYLLWDKKESKYINNYWSTKASAKASIAHRSIYASDIINNKYTFLRPDDLSQDLIEYLKQDKDPYYRVKYADQIRYECREIDITQAQHEVV